MSTVEFNTIPHNGTINIPQDYQEWFEKPVKVILLSLEEDEETATKQQQKTQAKRYFENTQLDLSDYRFNREDANER